MMNKVSSFFNIENKKHSKLILILLSLILFTGIFSVFTRYPMSWYDEQVHYARVLTYSNNLSASAEGYISESEQELLSKSMGKISQSLGQETHEILSLNWKEDFKGLSKSDKLIKTKDSAAAAIYTPFVYTPYIIAVWLAKLFSLSTISTFLFVRMVGFLTVFIMLIFALRKIPFGKLSILIIASIPTVTLSFTAISADTLTYGLIFLYTAQFLYIYQSLSLEKHVTNRDLVFLLIYSIGLVFSKVPSFALVGLYIPLIYIGSKYKILSKKWRLILTSAIFLCAFLTVAWLLMIRNLNANVSYYGFKNIDQAKQISFIIQHPLRTIKVFVDSILNYPYFNFQLGYSDFTKAMYVPTLVSFFSILSFFYSFRIQDNNQSIIRKESRILYNIFSKIVFIGIVVLIFLIFYLQNTEVGSESITGLQARYFFPFLVLLIPFSNGKNVLDDILSDKIIYLSSIPLIYYLLLMIYQLRN